MAEPRRQLVSAQTPTVVEALDRAVDAVQNIVGDQIALLKTDVSTATRSAVRTTAMVIAGSVFLLIGWVIALMFANVVLAPRIGVMRSLLALAGTHLVIGAGLFIAARGKAG